MRGLIAVPICIAVTALSWGTYGPVLHLGQLAMSASGREFAFMCVGLAYFIVAVMFPVIRLKMNGETGSWTIRGTITSTLAGAVGAIGALGIILAFGAGGSPIYVMPIVFGGAPVVNTFVSMVFAKAYKDIRPVFLFGLALVITGAVLVLTNKPTVPSASAAAGREVDTMLVVSSIILTAICWGSYGPFLHKGQSAMHGSRLRPFICVGMAYFLVAVIGSALWLGTRGISLTAGWTGAGGGWSLAAGAVGAIGALGIIYAFNFGGKPVYVMPLVFGGAPVVTTLTEMAVAFSKGQRLEPKFLFFLGMATVIVGAAMTLVFAPRGKPGGAAKAKSSDTPAAAAT